MQWHREKNAGFTTGNPWLKVHPNFISRNVESQKDDPNSLLNFYQALIALRKSVPALREGMFLPLHHNPQKVLAYLRQTKEQTVLVALNYSRRSAKLAVGGEISRHPWEVLLSSKKRTRPIFERGWLKLEGNEACILIQK